MTVIDDESTGTPENLASVRDHFNFSYVRGSAADKSLVRRLLVDVDEVYHLAAAVGVNLIYTAPIHTIETNIYPTELLLSELVRRAKNGQLVKLFLASSSEVYGKNPKERWSEDDDLVLGATQQPRWSYGASKAIDEFLALAYWRQHRLPVVIGRFFNVVGARQTGRFGMVLPRFVEAALVGRPLLVYGDGQQSRCFAHVADVVRAVSELMDSDAAVAGVFNIGSDEPITIADLALRVINTVNPDLTIEMQPYSQVYAGEHFEDVRARVPDLTRLRTDDRLSPRVRLGPCHSRRDRPHADAAAALNPTSDVGVELAMSAAPHLIRLRGPWQYEPLERQRLAADGQTIADDAPLPPPGEAILPADWTRTLGADFRGRVRYRRPFGRPTNLAAGQAVWLVVGGVDLRGQAWLNDQPLGPVDGYREPARFLVTDRLAERNHLIIEVELPPLDFENEQRLRRPRRTGGRPDRRSPPRNRSPRLRERLLNPARRVAARPPSAPGMRPEVQRRNEREHLAVAADVDVPAAAIDPEFFRLDGDQIAVLRQFAQCRLQTQPQHRQSAGSLEHVQAEPAAIERRPPARGQQVEAIRIVAHEHAGRGAPRRIVGQRQPDLHLRKLAQPASPRAASPAISSGPGESADAGDRGPSAGRPRSKRC